MVYYQAVSAVLVYGDTWLPLCNNPAFFAHYRWFYLRTAMLLIMANSRVDFRCSETFSLWHWTNMVAQLIETSWMSNIVPTLNAFHLESYHYCLILTILLKAFPGFAGKSSYRLMFSNVCLCILVIFFKQFSSFTFRTNDDRHFFAFLLHLMIAESLMLRVNGNKRAADIYWLN